MINLIPKIHAFDQIVDIGAEATKGDFFGFTCIWSLVSNTVSVAFILAGIVFFLILVLGGIEWLTSGGDKAKLQDAQKKIINAFIGIAIIAASWAIFTLVLYFFGINLDNICTESPVGS